MDISNLMEKFQENGYFIIENGFSPDEINSMRERIEDLAAGKFKMQGRRFQVDTDSGKYEDVSSGEMTYRGPDVAYRKISDLEYDEVFLRELQSDWLKEICLNFVGDIVTILRVTMMDKPAKGGTHLPWHQDISMDWPTVKQPKFAIWFPLDDATAASGTLQVIPGSHKHGMINRGHLLPESLEAELAPKDKIIDVEIKAGSCLFFHPAILHRSGINTTISPRRAVNAILMDGPAIHTTRNKPYPVLFGDGHLRPEVVSELIEIPR